jgi:GNAT superfamily N-acetyltransferase
MKTRNPQQSDLSVWVNLRHALWPDHDIRDLEAEAKALLESATAVCFLAVDDSSQPVGFIEGEIHSAPAGPYGHVEGWYVVPERRGQGYGRELMGQFEQWCLHRAICLLTSDTTASYPLSPAVTGSNFRSAAGSSSNMKPRFPPFTKMRGRASMVDSTA